MAKKKPWQQFERKAAKNHRGRYVGGPGQPDYTRGDVQGEAKLRQRPLTRTEVMEECQKGRTEIVSSSGFTGPAKDYVERYRPGVKLISGK